MHKAASKALGFLVATCCFLNLFSPAALNIPANSVDEIHAETMEEVVDEEETVAEPGEEEAEAFEEVIDSEKTQNNDSENDGDDKTEDESEKAQNLLLTSDLSDAIIRQKDENDWIELNQDEDYNYLLNSNLNQLQMELTFKKKNDAEWNSKNGFWFKLPNLKHLSYEEKDGKILNVDKEEIGTFGFENEVPCELEENNDLEEDSEEAADAKDKEPAKKENWLFVLPDDNEKFDEEDSFSLSLILNIKDNSFIFEDIEFNPEEVPEIIHLLNMDNYDKEAFIFGTSSAVTVSVADQIKDNKFSALRKITGKLQETAETDTLSSGNMDSNEDGIALYADGDILPDFDKIPSLNEYITIPDQIRVEYRENNNREYKTIHKNNDGTYHIPHNAENIRLNADFKLPKGTFQTNGSNLMVYTFPPDIVPAAQMTGDILDPVTDDKVGTYTVYPGTDGKQAQMVLDFDQNLVDKNQESEVDGDLLISGSIKTSKEEIKNEINFGANYTLKLTYEADTSLETKKEANGGNQNLFSNIINYKLTVHSPKQTEDGITIHDVIHDRPEITILKETVEIKDENGNEITVSDDNIICVNNTLEIKNIPDLAANTGYVITYQAQIPDTQTNSIGISNRATFETKDMYGHPINSSAGAWVEYKGKPKITKSGKINNTGKYEWTITIDSNHKDLSGWSLTDLTWDESNPTKISYNGEAKISYYGNNQMVGNSEDIVNLSKFVFPSDKTYDKLDKIVINYTTGDASSNDGIQHNEVTINGPGDEKLTGEGTIAPGNPLNKQSTDNNQPIANLTSDDDGYLLNWNINVKVGEGKASLEAPWTITDVTDGNSYFSKVEIKNLANTIKTLTNRNESSNGFSIQLYSKNGDTAPQETIYSSNIDVIDNSNGKYEKIVFI